MKTKGRFLAAVLAAVTAVMSLTGCSNPKNGGSSIGTQQLESQASTPPAAASMTTMELVQDMGLGINLGNTFEAVGGSLQGGVSSYEKSWGSPLITRELIEGYKNEGFGVLRVPVAWSNMMEEDYTIYPEYLTRVHEVVDWALDAGLYVILNIHWDGGWWDGFAEPDKKDACMTKYTRIWEQLCAEFGEEDERLMFESLNEEGCWDSIWNHYSTDETGKDAAYGLLYEINTKFVEIVRGAGGHNGKRHLLIAGYCTDVDCTCDPMFEMPEDPENRCAVSVHYYTPSTFCILEYDADWGKARPSWGSPRDELELTKNMDKLTERFVSQGVPVIIGEYGCPHKNKEEASIRKFVTAVARAALERDCCPVLWDTTGNFYDRNTCQMTDQTLKEQLQEILAADRKQDAAA